MDTALIVLVSLLVGGVAVAFYMDWLGLWVSKEEMKEEVATAKERMRQLEEQSGLKTEETGLVGAGREAAAHSCRMLPINAKEVAGVLAHAQADNQPGRQTRHLKRAQALERWQGKGGQG